MAGCAAFARRAVSVSVPLNCGLAARNVCLKHSRKNPTWPPHPKPATSKAAMCISLTKSWVTGRSILFSSPVSCRISTQIGIHWGTAPGVDANLWAPSIAHDQRLVDHMTADYRNDHVSGTLRRDTAVQRVVNFVRERTAVGGWTLNTAGTLRLNRRAFDRAE